MEIAMFLLVALLCVTIQKKTSFHSKNLNHTARSKDYNFQQTKKKKPSGTNLLPEYISSLKSCKIFEYSFHVHTNDDPNLGTPTTKQQFN